MAFDPKEQLLAGVEILNPFMRSQGFRFALDRVGNASGGRVAVGAYARKERRLELHYRYGLGIVRYRIGTHALGHAVYIRLLGVSAESQWVRVAMDQTLEGFHRLLHDLRHFCDDFLAGSGEQFIMLAEQFARNPRMFSGFGALDRQAEVNRRKADR